MAFEIFSTIPSSSASSSVNARYTTTSSAISGGDATITYSTKDYDTNNAYSGGVYTVPVAGKYQINAACRVNAAYVVNNVTQISVYVNSSQIALSQTFAAASQTALVVLISDCLNLAANDLVEIKGASNGSTPSYAGNNDQNYFSIYKTS